MSLIMVLMTGTSFFIHCIIMFASEHMLPIYYPDNCRLKRLTYTIHGAFSSVMSIILGVLLLLDIDIVTSDGIWQGIMLPSFPVDVVFILAYRKAFPVIFSRFIFIHHGIAIGFLIILIILNFLNIVDLLTMAPYILIWNGSTLISNIHSYWYLHNIIINPPVNVKHNFYMNVWYILCQRIWRGVVWIPAILIHYDNIYGLTVIAIMAGTLEILDIQDQIRSTIKLYKKKNISITQEIPVDK